MNTQHTDEMREEIRDIHRFIGTFRKWLPDLAKIDTNLRFANILPSIPNLDPGAFSATDHTTRVTAATLFKMLEVMGREEMHLRQAATAAAEAKYLPVIEKLVATSNALRNCNRSDFDMTFKEACVLHDEAIALAAPLLGGKQS